MKTPTGTQLNYGFATQLQDHLFINFAKTTDAWVINGSPSEDYRTLTDDDDYLTKMPTGATSVEKWCAIYDLTASGPEGADKLVVTWDGGGDITLHGNTYDSTSTSLTLFSSGTNTKTYTVTAFSTVASKGYGFVIIRFNSITFGNRITNVRVMRESHVAMYAAGKRMNPLAVAFFSIPKVLRTMQAVNVNNSPEVLWANRKPPTSFSEKGRTVPSRLWAGAASFTTAENQYVSSGTLLGSPSSWTHGDTVIFQTDTNLVSHTIQAITKANPCAVQCNGHGLTTGMKFEFPPIFSMTELASVTATVTVSDANNFTLNGINSTGYTTFTSGSGRRQITLATSTLPVKPLRRMTNDSLFTTEINVSGTPSSRYAVYDSVLDSLLLAGPGQQPAGYLPSCVSWESLIDFANDCNNDLWVNIPHMATDAYVSSLIALILSRLNLNLAVYVELSNEVWNTADAYSGNTTWMAVRAQALWGAATTRPTDQYFGKRCQEIFELFTTAFAGQMSRLVRVLGVHTAESNATVRAARCDTPAHDLGTSGPGFNTVPGTGKKAYEWTDLFAIDTYYGINGLITDFEENAWKYQQGGTLRNEALAFGNAATIAYINNRETASIDSWKTYADTKTNLLGNKLRICAYEGGWSSTYDGGSFTFNGDTITAAMAGNFIEAVYVTYGGLHNQLVHNRLIETGPAGVAGGVLSSQYAGIYGGYQNLTQPWAIKSTLLTFVSEDAWNGLTLINAGKRQLYVGRHPPG